MKTHALAALTLAAPLIALPAAAATDEPPTIIERIQRKFAENEDMRKLGMTQPEALKAASWMAGDWNAVVRTHATKVAGEKVENGTRTTRFELGGRWILSRNKGAGPVGEDAAELIGYDPYQRLWRWQFFSSVGRGTNAALTSNQGWDDNRLTFNGTFWIWGDSADVSLRIVKMSNDEYYEIFEEKLPGGLTRPFLEYHYTRAKNAESKPPAKPASR